LSEGDRSFESLLDYVRSSRGFDFTAYKRSSLMRRTLKRMQLVGVAGYQEYMRYLQVHPGEFEQLFNTILINVTGFFRDEAAWAFLASDVLGPMVERRGTTEPLRAWSAGCSSGEEAYTLAILLAEALVRHHGEEQGLEILGRFVRIYATDVDEEALQQARRATYTAEALEPLSARVRDRYFEQSGSGYTFRVDLRRSVIFGRHNLVQDPPIPHLDLLVCRNTLMYLTTEAQRRILARFHFALDEGGTLFLGRAETLLTHAHLFAPVDLRHRVFAQIRRENSRKPPAAAVVARNQAAGVVAAPDAGKWVLQGDAQHRGLGAAGSPYRVMLPTEGNARHGVEGWGHAGHESRGGDKA